MTRIHHENPVFTSTDLSSPELPVTTTSGKIKCLGTIMELVELIEDSEYDYYRSESSSRLFRRNCNAIYQERIIKCRQKTLKKVNLDKINIMSLTPANHQRTRMMLIKK
jgi:hypothetical protein